MQEPTRTTSQPRACDNCGAPESSVVHLEPYGGELLCAPHAAERRYDDAQDEEIGRCLGQLLEDRYGHDPDRLVRLVKEFADLRDDLILSLMRGRTWAEIHEGEAMPS